MTTPRADRWCCRIVELAARLLPPAQRQRYALEFIAELYGMPRPQQIRHSIQVLASAWQLRAVLAEASPTPFQEDTMTMSITTTARPLRCRIGFHHWHTMRTQEGDQYESCTRCGKDRTENYGGGPLIGGMAAGPPGIVG